MTHPKEGRTRLALGQPRLQKAERRSCRGVVRAMPAPLELIARNAHGNHLAAKKSGGNAVEGLEHHVRSKGKGMAPK